MKHIGTLQFLMDAGIQAGCRTRLQHVPQHAQHETLAARQRPTGLPSVKELALANL